MGCIKILESSLLIITDPEKMASKENQVDEIKWIKEHNMCTKISQ